MQIIVHSAGSPQSSPMVFNFDDPSKIPFISLIKLIEKNLQLQSQSSRDHPKAWKFIVWGLTLPGFPSKKRVYSWNAWDKLQEKSILECFAGHNDMKKLELKKGQKLTFHIEGSYNIEVLPQFIIHKGDNPHTCQIWAVFRRKI